MCITYLIYKWWTFTRAFILDEETALDTPENADWDEETQDFMRSYWKSEFCPVASQLLQRVERCQSALIPIGDES